MRIAYVHVLPLEYYPPATNMLSLLARKDWDVRVWSTHNARQLDEWRSDAVTITRRGGESERSSTATRLARFAGWHARTAIELRSWKPDAIVAVEPHSTLAVWLYYSIARADTPLFLHHHEYYSPADFQAPGMRRLRMARRLEGASLFKRAAWVSQTNATRLRLMLSDNPSIPAGKAHVLANYPPADWVARCKPRRKPGDAGALRLIYVGSASFDDTFLREVAQWVRAYPQQLSLHVVGNNVTEEIWTWLESLGVQNITTDRNGVDYDALPALLSAFDVGLVLYKGNTLNFVHNVPNKSVEYLACGLDVWYPAEMTGMREFAVAHPHWPIRELNFRELPVDPPGLAARSAASSELRTFPLIAEAALAPLIEEVRRATSGCR